MSEDAAAAARRIVAEVLGRDDVEGPRSAMVEGARTPMSASSDAPSMADPEGPAAVARRIVEQVLAGAETRASHVSEPPPTPSSRGGDRPGDEPGPEHDVQGTPPARPEPGGELQVPEMPDREAPSDGPGHVAATEEPEDAREPGAAGDQASAADIVRRIVSEITTQAAESSRSPSEVEEEGHGDQRAAEPEAGPTAGRREPTRELDPTAQDDAPPVSSLETEPTREVPTSSEALEQTQQVRRRPDQPATEPTREVPVEKSSDAAAHPEASTVSGRETTSDAAPPEAAVSVLDHTAGTADHPPPVEKDGGFEATVNAPEALSTRHEPLIAPPGTGSHAETAPTRWLMISILGALALAVLFPMAVAALRALVALG